MVSRLFLVSIDPDAVPIAYLEKIEFRYDLTITFAHDEVVPSMKNILHLSKEGAKGIQSYDVSETTTDDLIQECIAKSRMRHNLEL
jgi:hypothetical protein